MVLYRRKRIYRKKSTLKRLTKPRKTTAIQTLAKQIQSIKRTMKGERQIINYRMYDDSNIGTALSSDFTVFNWSTLQNWQYVFGTTADDEEMNQAKWLSFGVDMLFKAYNEPTEVNFTVFHVRCKDSMAPFVNLTTGAVSLTANQHYVNSSTGGGQTAAGLVMLNKKYFNILGIKRFTLGNNGTTLGQPSAQTQFGTDIRVYKKFSPSTILRNPNGNWRATGCVQDVSQVYLTLVFNNNASADAENPRMFYNCVHTVQV